jgi:hypothetical protein
MSKLVEDPAEALAFIVQVCYITVKTIYYICFVLYCLTKEGVEVIVDGVLVQMVAIYCLS